ncbi:MFS transporter [Nocardioides sp.]|uniref:MFS transporter n=1 Tax=Nocardioides sp. TaxID=35761 RepID=UPI003784A3B0
MTLVQRPPLTMTGRSRTVSPVLLAVLVAAVLHLLWWQFLATSGGDIAAQDAWAEFARSHPDSAYNLAWYGGMHPVSYSVVSPYIMAQLGVRATMILAGTISAGLLAWLVVGRREERGRWLPALYGAVALAGNALSGRVTFALGTLFALAALCVVFAWPRPTRSTTERWLRGLLAVVTSALATAASPVAGAFLGLVAATLWLRKRRPAAYALGVPPVLVVAASALLFPFSGRQPMAWYSAILPIAMGVAVVILTPQRWRTVQAGGALYIVAVLAAWLVPSPVGTNVSRLGLLFGGVVLVAAITLGAWRTSLVGRRYGVRAAQVVLAMALITSTIWQVAYAVRDVVSSAPPESFSSDIGPLLYQLRARQADHARVEVVPTKSHREAAAIAPHVPLARGWNRQADAERNPVFYRDRDLDAHSYRRWLHRWAVGYVVLATTAKPDPAAAAEAELVAGGLPYLDQVWADDEWTLYQVRRATPLVSPPATVVAYDAAELTISTPRAGRIVVRIADSPWLSLVDANGDPIPNATDTNTWYALGGATDPACLSGLDADLTDEGAGGPRDDWLVLHAPAPGTYRIAAPYKLPRGTSCPTRED